MIRAFRAELTRLIRRKVLLASALVVLIAGFGGAAVALASAKPATRAGTQAYTPTYQSLSEAGGGTEVFRYAVAFAGTLVFVVFVGLFALEFSRGTYRTMLLRQPLRARLLLGRLLALLSFAAVALAAIEMVAWVAAHLEAGPEISTRAWTSLDALGSAASDFGAVLVWVCGYAVLAMTIAVLVRSLPIALALGIAWAGPAEHLIGGAWTPGERFFPGLLLENFAQGGTAEVSATRALLTIVVYIAVTAGISFAVFSRRDVTA